MDERERTGETSFLQSQIQNLGREIKGRLQSYKTPYREMAAYYRCAMMEVETKFRVLNEELSLEYDHNPIETIKSRMKSLDSIADKLMSKNLSFTVENVENHIFDVAGIRVICGFPSDIYALSEAFLRQDDIRLVERKDYIKTPKANGYRSLHLIVEVPIFLHDEKKLMKVEVQFRTMAMDWWASLEHKIRYKKDVEVSPEIARELYACAEIADNLDQRMESISRRIAADNEEK